jgi:hypothetical protein
MSDPSSTDDEPIEESMFERTAAGVVRFIGRSLFTTGLALVLPQWVAKLAHAGDKRLAQPLSYLTATMFLAGVSVRMHNSHEWADEVGANQLVDDLRETFSQASLATAAMLTFPCVLIVVALATLLAWAAAVGHCPTRSPLFACCCYAAGFLYAMIAVLLFGSIGYRVLLGLEFSPFEYDGFYYTAMGLVFYCVGEGMLIIAASLAEESRRAWARTLRYPAAFAVTCVAGIACGVALEASFDVEGADDASYEAYRKQERTGLKIDTIKWTGRPNPAGGPDIVTATLALSNLDAAPLIIPCPEALQATRSVRQRDPSLSPEELPVELTSRLLSCSISQLDGAALLIDPGQTRLITIEYAPPEELAQPTIQYDQVPYTLTYEKPSDLRYFDATLTELWLPAPYYAAERTAQQSDTAIERK